MLYSYMANWIALFQKTEFEYQASLPNTAEMEKERAKLKYFIWNLIGTQIPALFLLLLAQALVTFGLGICEAVESIGSVGMYLSLWLMLKLVLDSFSRFYRYDSLWLCLGCQWITLFTTLFTIFSEVKAGLGSPLLASQAGHLTTIVMIMVLIAQVYIVFTSCIILGMSICLPSSGKEIESDPAKAPHLITIQTINI